MEQKRRFDPTAMEFKVCINNADGLFARRNNSTCWKKFFTRTIGDRIPSTKTFVISYAFRMTLNRRKCIIHRCRYRIKVKNNNYPRIQSRKMNFANISNPIYIYIFNIKDFFFIFDIKKLFTF